MDELEHEQKITMRSKAEMENFNFGIRVKCIRWVTETFLQVTQYNAFDFKP
jgi:hypothetical protein